MRLSSMPASRRWALTLCLLSFTGFSTWELVRPARSPFMDLAGVFTDHFSHMNAGRLFTRFGLDVWRKPLTKLLPHATPAEEARLPFDERACRDCVFIAPGWRRPVLQSWAHVVRFYPPGDMLLTAPLAALYHFTSVPAVTVNRLLLVLLLACAHLGLFLMLEDLFAAPENLRWQTLLPAFLGGMAVLHWTLEGFYDCSMLAPLFLCWRYLGQRRGLAAGVAFCAAAFLHFRAFYYAPWALAAGLLVLRERQWRTWTRRDWLAAAAASLFGAASLTSYFLALPGMIAFGDYLSPLLVTKSHLDPAALLTGALIAAVALAAFVAARSWFDVLMIPWLTLVLTTVRQTMPWYMIAVVPWLCSVPRPGRSERAPLVLDGRVLIFLFLAITVHADQRIGLDVVPEWLARRLY